MRESEFRKLIEKYQRGQLSAEDKAMVDDWFDAMAPGNYREPMTDEARLRLKNRILDQINIENAPSLADGIQESRPSERTIWQIALRAAAAILLMATFSYAIWHFTKHTGPDDIALVKVSSTANISKIVLDDGSIVWLKKNSSLIYPKKFSAGQRFITLEGEALFQVAKDTLSPFTIQCGELMTTVLGTSFNIKASEKDIEVVVLTGKVSLTSSNDKKGVIVLPNEKARYLVGQKQIAKIEKEVDQEEAKATVAGTEYIMKFEDTRMEEVIRRIEGKFNVVVKTGDPSLRNCMVTADFSGQSLERTLSMIALALGFEYEIRHHTVVLTGAGCPMK